MLNEKLKKYLDSNGVKYGVLRHGEAYTAQEIAATMHVSGKMLVKVVMLKSDKGFIMLALPADRRVDIPAVVADLGLKMATLASEDDFRRLFPDCDAGAMPPFGNLYGVPVYVDKSLAGARHVIFQAGTHSEAVKMSYDDFIRLADPQQIEASRQAA